MPAVVLSSLSPATAVSISAFRLQEPSIPSTAIRDIAYDPQSRTLDVTFISSGRRYRYFEVTLDEYDVLRRAFSKGAWFNTHIKPLYDYELLFEPSAA